MRKLIIALLFAFAFFSQGCISEYIANIDENVAENLNDFNVYVNVGEDKLTIYNAQGTSKEFSYNSCTDGLCTFFICKRSAEIDNSNPYDFIYGQSLFGGHCFTPFLVMADPEIEEDFAIGLYKNQQVENVKYNIGTVGVSQGATPFEFNEANPSCNNHITYPVFTIPGTDDGYIISPYIAKQAKCFIEKNRIPVFIFNSDGTAPSPDKDNSAKIASWIATIDSTAIIFTEASPENSEENINRIVDQLHGIAKACKATDLSDKYEFRAKCISGLSVPFTGNPKDSYDFYKKVEMKYAQKYGIAKNSFLPSNPGEGLNEISLMVGFPLISSKLPSSSCNGYELISNAMKTAKKFAFNKLDLPNLNSGSPRLTFIQGIEFDEPETQNMCNMTKIGKTQAYYSLFTSAGGLSRYGIINIPSAEFYDSGISEGSAIAEKENEKIKPIQNEYSDFFSYCQQYYERQNYRAISFRSSATSQLCPLQILMPSTDYLNEKTGQDFLNEPLFNVDPGTSSNVKSQIYRCESCFSYSKPEVFLNQISANSIPDGTCIDEFAHQINLQSSKFGVDPDFLKAISLVETGGMQNRQCAISFVSSSNNKCNLQNLEIADLKPALEEAGCSIPQERYLVSNGNFEECVLRSDPRVTSSSPKCKPCAYGFLQTTSYPGYIYQEKNIKMDNDVKVCNGEDYNPFIAKDNACSSSARTAGYISVSFDLMDRYGDQMGIDFNNGDDIGRNSAFLSATMYERGSISQTLLSDFTNIKKLKERGTNEACENAPEPAKSYCCKEKNGKWEFDGNGACCKSDFFEYVNSCNIASFEYARKAMGYYKGTLQECKMCYNEEWKQNACDYAKEIAQADVCKGETAKQVNPFSSVYSSEQLWQNYIKSVEERRSQQQNPQS